MFQLIIFQTRILPIMLTHTSSSNTKIDLIEVDDVIEYDQNWDEE